MLTKLLIMYKLTFLFLLFSMYAHSQVVPIGTVIKGKRLPNLLALDTPNVNNRSATLYGSIKINDSKLSIVENGFVVLLGSDSRIPDVSNSSKFVVGAGIADFKITINTFSSNTSYKYRAYAKNSKGEIAYSQIITFKTYTDWCEVNPCKNAATCASTDSGPLCTCTVSFCGDCCAQLADASCPGGGDQQCIASFSSAKNLNLKFIQLYESLTMNNKWYNNQITNKAILK
jgi:hypothetical protein